MTHDPQEAEKGATEWPDHSPEVMSVLQVWRKGVLQAHTVEFSHDCGLTAKEIQEELPW